MKMTEAKAAGFTAVGHLNPFLDEPEEQRYFQTHSAKIAGAVDACAVTGRLSATTSISASRSTAA